MRRPLPAARFAAAGLAVLLLIASSARGDVIAQWRFEPDDPETPENEFLLDSSGRGNLLANYGAASITDPDAGLPGSGSAAFDGSVYMCTAAPLDLSPYRHVRVSWWQKIDTDTGAIIWEHSSTFIGHPGSIVADVNDAGNTGRGLAGVWTASFYYNLDAYYHSYDNSWEHMAVEIDLDALTGADVVRVFRNGNPAGVVTGAQATDTVPLRDDVFYLGARGGSSVFLTGCIDELTIESLASPPPVIPPIEHEPVKLFVLAGQSNMVGQYAYAAELPPELQGEQADVVVYNRGTWSTLRPGIGAASSEEFGPEVTFGREMADAMSGQSVVLVKYAVGATTLAEDWNPNAPGPLYTGLVDAVNEAVAELSPEHDVEIAGMAWMQGESDAFDLGKSEAYEANLRDFIQSLRDAWDEPDLPFVIGEIASDPVWTHYDVVQQAEADVAATTSDVTAFSTDDLPTTNHHYNTEGQILLGRRFADAMMTPGDANFDGYVDDRDASILASHWQTREGATWGDGDFNRDGKVNDADAAILAAHWRESPPGEDVPAPEPAVAIMLAGVAGVLLLRRSAGGRQRRRAVID